MADTRSPGKRLRARVIRESINAQRTARQTERKIELLLRESLSQVKRRFEERLAWIASRGYDASDFTLQRLEANLRDLRAVLRQGYREAGQALRADLMAAGRYELQVRAEMLKSAALDAGAGQVSTIAPSHLLKSIVDSKPFQGGLLKDWARKMEADGFARIQREIRTGLSLEESPRDVVRRLVGRYDRRSGTYRGGVLDGAIKHEVANVVETAYAHVRSEAQMALYRENDDVVEYVIWDSIMDEKTTEFCYIRHGLRYTLDGEPIGHSVPWEQGPGKSHWGCRAEALPGIAGLDDPVREGGSFAGWLEEQDYDTRVEAIGRRRADLLKSGQLNASQLYTRQGRWRSYAEVEKLARRAA